MSGTGGGAATAPAKTQKAIGGVRRKFMPWTDPAAVPLIRFENVTKRFGGFTAVDNVSLDVHEGEVVGLLGANGAGKTTTFYMAVGLERPQEGRVYLNGRDVTHLPMYLRARLGLGYLPQEPSIFRKLTAEQNILAVLETLSISPPL